MTAATASPALPDAPTSDEVLAQVADRVLWLSTAMIDHANRVRPNQGGAKVGGHEASSASLVTVMTALWFEWLRPEDRVSVKPHASPVLHAINYLLGWLEQTALSTLREFGGLQSYPSRTKDPDPVDYSTGSVGIGATAPIWGALARRYLGDRVPGRRGRQYSLVGDAELDEGACWEAVLDATVAELGEIVWIVDVNRQSLDRIVPNIAVDRLRGMFSGAGWQVLDVKYGARLSALMARPGGHELRRRIDEMGNPEYQRLLRCPSAEARTRLVGNGPAAAELQAVLADLTDEQVCAAIRDLGGHDLAALRAAFAAIDDTRPTVILAYTIKGYRLPVEAHPQNHSALLSTEQIASLAATLGVDPDRPWARFEPGTAADLLCRQVADHLRREPPAVAAVPAPPVDLGRTPSGVESSQAALGRTLLDLNRAAPEVSSRVVTVSPDVSSSTNLGGWINKTGIWSTAERHDWFSDDGERILRWVENPRGQHIELGIAETNLVGLIGELGCTWSRWGVPLAPIGVLYDPFVERALEPWSFGMYAGGQSILVGTPSGVTLAPEGGAHQSITTPSIGLEQPGCISYEPAFAIDVGWVLLDGIARVGRPDGSSTYLRLSTRPVDQALAQVPADPAARERRRRAVLAGAYALRRASEPMLTICAMGALVPEALDAGRRLGELGYDADVVCITSPGQVFRAVQARRGIAAAPEAVLESVFPENRALPMITVLDGHPHTLAFLAGIRSVPATHLGVSSFGQSGDLANVYRHHGVDADSIVCAGLDLVD